MKWYLKVLKENYANFNGRARRKEFWMYNLFNILIMYACIFALGAIAFAIENPLIIFVAYIYIFATIIPSIAVGARRMHDVGKSGWFQLIPIYGFILSVTEGESGPNKYGPDPKGADNDEIQEIGQDNTL